MQAALSSQLVFVINLMTQTILLLLLLFNMGVLLLLLLLYGSHSKSYPVG